MKAVSLLVAGLIAGQASSAIVYQGTYGSNAHGIQAKISVKNSNAVVQIKKVTFGSYGGRAMVNEGSPMVEGLSYDQETREVHFNETLCGTFEKKTAYSRGGKHVYALFEDNGDCEVSVELLKDQNIFRVHLN